MNTTSNYNLGKPVGTEKYSVDVINNNMDSIDAALKSLSDRLSNVTVDETDPTVPSWAKQSNKPAYTKSEIGLDNVDNTSDASKPVSTAQQIAINTALLSAKSYTDTKISNLINGAPDTMDTLKEISDAISENETIVDILNSAISTKANTSDLEIHTSDTDIHVTAENKTLWTDAVNKAHNHSNKTVLDGITDTLITAWNNALAHVSDTIKHITSDERSLWNTVSNKVDKVAGKGLSANDLTNTLKNQYDTAYIHSQSIHAPTDAEKNNIVSISKNGTVINPDDNRSVDISVPIKVSQLTNDSGYITSAPSYEKATQTVDGLLSKEDKKKLDGISTGANKIIVDDTLSDTSLNPVQNKVVKESLDGKSDVSHQHTISDITDFPTSMPASDVSAWAKANTKPTYTANEVGLGNVGNFKAVSTVASQGLSDTEKSNARANIGAGTSSFDGNYNSLSNKPTIPTKVSQLINDSGYKTTNNDTTYTLTQDADDGHKITLTSSSGTTMTVTIPDNNTIYTNFVKSGSGAKAGLVPAPSTTVGKTKYLREDGIWAVPPNTTGNIIYSVTKPTTYVVGTTWISG